MKTLCVVAAVLSLSSVCQTASLACEKLLKPVDKGPDLSGSWYIIAMSTSSCLITTIVSSVIQPSIEIDITSTGTPNLYSFETMGKIFGYCINDTEEFLYENNNMYDVDSNNAPTGSPGVLLQSSCPDCMAVKEEDKDTISTFFLFSRRKYITAAELQEFEAQAECLGWSKPQVFSSDHDYKNCTAFNDDFDATGLSSMIFQRLINMYRVHLSCLSRGLLYYSNEAHELFKQAWNTLW